MNGRRNGLGAAGNKQRAEDPRELVSPEARVVPREGNGPGPAARIYLTGAGGGEVEITGCLTAAIAHCIWQARGGPDVENWVDAERVLCAIAGIKAPARREAPAPAPGPLPEPSGPMPVVTPRRSAGRV